MKQILLLLLFGLELVFSGQINAEELPRGSTENCFYILPLFETIRVPGALTLEEKRHEILRMKAQLGNGNLYHRLGFSSIYAPNVESEVRPVLQMLQEAGLHYGVIFALQSHTRNPLRAIADKDFRLFQWRKDGIDWKGSYTSSGNLEVPEDERDYKLPTPSRYAISLRTYNALQAREWAGSVKKLMIDFPGVITCINGPIEEELAIGGNSNTDKLGDYSPFAITEFRDWLRHSGFYDASSGKYKGEGASELIVGNLISFNGTPRSQFYDDPSPAESNGTGISFNDFFGTDFKTWSLRYWDLDMYPAAITDPAFDCTPESGKGFCSGGFDAPRVLNATSKFWCSWSYDVPDQLGMYPPGNPEAPAFGFRQNLVRNFVRDLFQEIASVGIPKEIMYAHQIPGEALGNFTGAGGRNRSSASIVWTGYLEKSQTVGITRFGGIDPVLMTQYANDWGIFEWHTLPNADPNTQALYTTSLNHINNYYQHKCHYLFPGWWSKDAPDNNSIFPLNDSRFADAIRDFVQTCTEVPYHQQGTTHDYTPPQVIGLSGKIDGNKLLSLKWNEYIWTDLLQKWSNWGQFANFDVQTSGDGINWTNSTKTTQPVFSVALESTSVKVRVRAVSKTGLYGNWSEVANLSSQVSVNQLKISPEFSSLYADPEMSNKITVSTDDSFTIPDFTKMSVSISGDGLIKDIAPENSGAIEKFWPMNSPSELMGIYRLENTQFSGGLFQAVVSAQTPIDPYFSFTGSSINGAQLPYISFRLYSDLNTTGQLFWFLSAGNKSVTFSIVPGWNVYSFSNLPEWKAQTDIKSVRLDPGITASANIKLDWFAVGSQPIATNLVPSFFVQGNKATFSTSPTATAGTYTVTVSIDDATVSTTIQTLASNQKPEVSFLLPVNDTIVETGSTLLVKAEAKDQDGKVNGISFLANNSVIRNSTLSPSFFEWIPSASGSYELLAEATDNAGESSRSAIKIIQVVDQKPYSGKAFQVPGILEVEDYDIGGDGISFHDREPLNQGGVYRTEQVDISKMTNGNSGHFVGWTAEGEWLEYTVEIKKGMKVDINLLLACAKGGGELHFEMNGKPLTNRLFVGTTGGDQQFKTFTISDIYLTEGIHQLRLVIDKGEVNLDQIRISERFPTSIPDVTSSAGISIYPNPARDQIRINGSSNQPIVVQIISLQGQTVKMVKLSPEESQVISVAGLPAGTYIVSGKIDGKLFQSKLIKLE